MLKNTSGITFTDFYMKNNLWLKTPKQHRESQIALFKFNNPVRFLTRILLI